MKKADAPLSTLELYINEVKSANDYGKKEKVIDSFLLASVNQLQGLAMTLKERIMSEDTTQKMVVLFQCQRQMSMAVDSMTRGYLSSIVKGHLMGGDMLKRENADVEIGRLETVSLLMA